MSHEYHSTTTTTTHSGSGYSRGGSVGPTSSADQEWRDACSKRYSTERRIWALLDAYFADPSDENLSTLQSLTDDRNKLDEAASAAYKRVKAERDAVNSSIISAASAPISAATAPGSTAYVKAMRELDERIKKWDAEEKVRKDVLAVQEAAELERLRRKQRSFGEKFYDWMNGK